MIHKEVTIMERNISSLKFGTESPAFSTTQARCRCSTCGEEFETPLLAMISSGFLMEKYYACPKCLSKVDNVERQENIEVDETELEVEEEETLKMEVEETMDDTMEEPIEENVACAHNLGYLKRRPKNTPIPEECLTCSKMIECMAY
jgi:DNA-directed RNA polymerase subunit RPC12/RpoP